MVSISKLEFANPQRVEVLHDSLVNRPWRFWRTHQLLVGWRTRGGSIHFHISVFLLLIKLSAQEALCTAVQLLKDGVHLESNCIKFPVKILSPFVMSATVCLASLSNYHHHHPSPPEERFLFFFARRLPFDLGNVFAPSCNWINNYGFCWISLVDHHPVLPHLSITPISHWCL